MATTFLEPGGDATFNVATTTSGGFWGIDGAVLATDFVHGNHIKSIQFNGTNSVRSPLSVMSDSGRRISFYLYVKTLPSADFSFLFVQNGAIGTVVKLRITTTGVLKLFEDTIQIGANGATLSTGTWYRISLAYTITDTTHNRFELFVDGNSSISVTNATITNTGSTTFQIQSNDASADFRTSDHYVDSSSSLTDTGNIWVTAKRPNANGTTNGFTTQIGAGGSGYGSGHSPQVNERALSTTNGWSVIGAGSAVTEEYNIEGRFTGDINILSHYSIIDYVGWVYASSLTSESASMILGGTTSAISLTSTNTMFTAVKGSSSYPPGSGADIGVFTDDTVTTVSLFECGIMVAYQVVGTPLGNDQPHFYLKQGFQ